MKKNYAFRFLAAFLLIIAAGTTISFSQLVLTNNTLTTWFPDEAEGFRPFGHKTAFYTETSSNILASSKVTGIGDANFAYHHQVVDISGMRTKMGKLYITYYDFTNKLVAEPAIVGVEPGKMYSFLYNARANKENSPMIYIFDEARIYKEDQLAPAVNAGLTLTKSKAAPTTEWAVYEQDSLIIPDSAYYFEVRIRINYDENVGIPVLGDWLEFDNWNLVEVFPESVRYDQAFKLKVYPNPASEQVTITTEMPGEKEVNIYDIAGKKVSRKTMNGNQQIFDIGNFTRGLYIVQITNGTSVQNTKLTVR